MRTFANKQNTSKDARSGDQAARTRAGHRQQRRMEDQFVQRPQRAEAERWEGGESKDIRSSFAHDFSRISVHAGVGSYIQPKLKVNAPRDKYEQEADKVADEVTRIPEQQLPNAYANRTGCFKCQSDQQEKDHRILQMREIGAPVLQRITTSSSTAEVLRSHGRPLDSATRSYMEPRFGYDFSNVRIYTDSNAATLATALRAEAFAMGQNIVFNRGVYSPHDSTGRWVLAHELTHVIQQRGSTQDQLTRERGNGPLSIQQLVATTEIIRLSASDCASDCAKEDGKGSATGKFSITIYADKEGPFLLLPLTHKVGHSWLRLEDDQGRYWTYGFWPQEGYDPSNIRADVEGCVHHPDTSHKPTASQRFELTATQFAAAFKTAGDICKKRPKYNLFGLQCTEFVKRVLAAAGLGSFGGFGLIWESPNALDSWIRTHSLILGTSFTAATSAAGKGGAGSFGLDITYRYQFYSLLGQKLRLYGLGRSEISGPIKSITTGAGLELNPQKVWLPAPFIEGGGILGDLSPMPEQSRFGAGITGSVGLRYNIDEVGIIGIEYNIVKDLVNKDPALHRLMLTAGIRFY